MRGVGVGGWGERRRDEKRERNETNARARGRKRRSALPGARNQAWDAAAPARSTYHVTVNGLP